MSLGEDKCREIAFYEIADGLTTAPPSGVSPSSRATERTGLLAGLRGLDLDCTCGWPLLKLNYKGSFQDFVPQQQLTGHWGSTAHRDQIPSAVSGGKHIETNVLIATSR